MKYILSGILAGLLSMSALAQPAKVENLKTIKTFMENHDVVTCTWIREDIDPDLNDNVWFGRCGGYVEFDKQLSYHEKGYYSFFRKMDLEEVVVDSEDGYVFGYFYFIYTGDAIAPWNN